MHTRYILIPLILLLGMAFVALVPTRFTMAPESTLWIEGTSTIHDWTCTAGVVGGTLDAELVAQELAQLTQVHVTVPVGDVDCKNGTMNKKMREALKASAHPTIGYTLDVAQAAAAGGTPFTTKGKLALAGKTLPLDITVTAEALDGGRYRFTGAVPLLMSAFDIDPPTAMLGTLKTGDAVTVHFDVVMRP